MGAAAVEKAVELFTYIRDTQESFHDSIHVIPMIVFKTHSRMRGISAPKMGSYAVLLWLLFIVASSRAAIHLSWPNEESEIDFWDDTAAKTKRSESSSSQSSYSSSSSSSSSSDSSGAFHFKVEEYEKKTDKSGTHEVMKTYEKKKPSGGNETSNTKTVEVTRFPNGTIQRKVKNRGPALKVRSNDKYSYFFYLLIGNIREWSICSKNTSLNRHVVF